MPSNLWPGGCCRGSTPDFVAPGSTGSSRTDAGLKGALTAGDVEAAGYRSTPYDGQGCYAGAPKPREHARVMAYLHGAGFFHSGQHEEQLDRVTRSVQLVTGFPTVLVSILDEGRQWFKSRVGLDAPETGRAESFCAWTLLPQEPLALVVEDATKDERFKGNVLVTGEPHIRCYVGSPITLPSSGMRIGALCTIDYKPRSVLEHDLKVLAGFADIVGGEIENGMRADQLFSAVEAFPEGFLVLSGGLDCIITVANKGWSKVAVDKESPVGRRLVDVLPGCNADFERSMERALQKEEVLETELPCTSESGEERWLLCKLCPIPSSFKAVGQSAVTRWFATVQDVTTQVCAREALVDAKRRADDASAAKGRFIANMSHELRTPMNAVITCSSLLSDMVTEGGSGQQMDKDSLMAEVHELSDMISVSGKQLMGVVNDVLDFSKIEADKLQLARDTLCLRRCVETCVEMVGTAANARRVTLGYTLDEAMPTHIMGDVVRLRQVIINLLSNAIKHTEDGEVLLDLRMADSAFAGPLKTGDEVELALTVRDSGCGISPEFLPHLFSAFKQEDSSRTRSNDGGTGLGLTIVKQLAERMGGGVSAESEQGVGSTFKAWFRLEVVQIEAERHTSEEGVRDVVLGGRRIVVLSMLADFVSTVCGITAYSLDMEADEPEAGTGATLRHAMEQREWPAEVRSAAALVLDIDHLPELPGSRDEALLALSAASDAAGIPLLVFGFHSPVQGSSNTRLVCKPVLPHRLASALRLSIRHHSTLASPLPLPGPSAAPDVPAVDSDARPLRILVAEDNMLNRRVLERTICSMGWTLLGFAVDGEELVGYKDLMPREQGEWLPVDVILMDIHMPRMDGLEATRVLRERLPREAQPCIVANTADAIVGVTQECRQAGMNGVLSKPLNVQKLQSVLSRIAQWVSKGRNPAELYDRGELLWITA